MNEHIRLKRTKNVKGGVHNKQLQEITNHNKYSLLMKQFILSCVLSVTAIAPSQAQQANSQLPVYLDQTQPVEQRIDDAISRMTLAEKILILNSPTKTRCSVPISR